MSQGENNPSIQISASNILTLLSFFIPITLSLDSFLCDSDCDRAIPFLGLGVVDLSPGK